MQVNEGKKMTTKQKTITINALGKDGFPIRYWKLNQEVRKAISKKTDQIDLIDVRGQRFIAAGIKSDIRINIHGVPGNDLGVFMDGPTIEVFGNAEDHTGNTMSSGNITIHGNAWDVTGLSARGGNIYVRGNGGYRIGIHMKEFGDMIPKVIYGGKVRQYFGEYMAGGILIALGLNIKSDGVIEEYAKNDVVRTNLGTGIHGGIIYVRGEVPDRYLGVGAVQSEISESDEKKLGIVLEPYISAFKLDPKIIWEREFTKITPSSSRPFASYYTYAQI
ncbi:MAG: hypothetical protein ACTSUV_04570 [Candidatus Ranarchaeia archaeon]